MAFSGGTYTLPAGNPVVSGTTIESSWANTTLSDIATALSTCVLKDGTQTIAANLPMAGFKFTGLGAGSSANDSVRMVQVQNGAISYLTGTAGTNTITATGNPTVTALAAGQAFKFIPAATNTGATTLQIDATAATNIFWNGAALGGGELRINVPVEVFYDGTQYQLIASAAMLNSGNVVDSSFVIKDNNDPTKQMMFQVSGVAAGTTSILTVITGSYSVVGDTTTQTLTNKTLTAPTITSGKLDVLVTGSAIATQADQETATAVNLIVSPGRQQFHPSAIKAWGSVATPTTVQQSYPATGVSVVANASGNFTITHGVAFSTLTYSVSVVALEATTTPILSQVSARTTNTFTVLFNTFVNAPVNGTPVVTSGIPITPAGFMYQIVGDL